MTADVQEVSIPGTPIRLGPKTYIVPPLNLEGLEKHEEDIEKAQQLATSANGTSLREQYTLVCNILLTALKRNYPETTLEELKKNVDLGNAPKVFQAVLGQSGYAQTKGEEPADV